LPSDLSLNLLRRQAKGRVTHGRLTRAPQAPQGPERHTGAKRIGSKRSYMDETAIRKTRQNVLTQPRSEADVAVVVHLTI